MIRTFRMRHMLAQRARRAEAARAERAEAPAASGGEASREAARQLPAASVTPFGEPLEGLTGAGGWA